MPIILVLLLFTLLQGCQSRVVNPAPPIKSPTIHYFVDESKYNIPDLESFYTLTDEQVIELERFLQAEDIAKMPRHQQASVFLQSRLVNFNFQGENLFASESLASRRGNCMALAMLTYAVAEQMQVELSFQVMHTMPLLLEVSDKFAVTSDHVRAFLYESGRDGAGYLSGRNRILIDYFPSRYDRGGKLIDHNEFFAMFYRNLAADAMLLGELERAFLLLKKGRSFAPEYGPAINMQAVVLRLLGDERAAEQLYRYGLEVSDNKITLLSNYHFLLSTQGRQQQAFKVKQRLLALDDPSPYKWYLQAMDAMAQDDFVSAKAYLNKFLENTRYYHKAYYDLAKIYIQLGEQSEAKKSLDLALHYSERDNDKLLYQAKLQWLASQ
ncbi:hypothetical protein L2719_15885 [Shewanella schlegeliana]|uniref:Tetratricopeptide repeat protein n=1 Tax=Shewanella schlegeliana TaxID=190308 RepID=A0ABS1T2U3_9GAMM|nr:hypothetical protein [Shewanella schlegeliana]MBL4915120.1 hypothetical protein [Shewanella schlegeliana]MCL1111013.1 hypothetical protein [Shewanella schlegeliana]GIU29207.1 hypothetical protein TUM4433_18210 [Shewanella schlegeliana]